MIVFYSFIILLLIGSILGFFLSVAEKKLKISKDSKLIELENAMPGANCGICGFAGCVSYAEAIFNGKAKIGQCAPGGQKVADKCSSIMGLNQEKIQKLKAVVFCNSDLNSTEKEYNYKGLNDCNSMYMLFKGSFSCKEGCLHLGACINICPENAIFKDSNGRINVNEELCIGCGKCVNICPTHVIKLIPEQQKYYVKCNNHQKGIFVKKECKIGCIGCKICQIKYPDSGFVVNDNLASYSDKSTISENTKKAMENCPQNIIFQI